ARMMAKEADDRMACPVEVAEALEPFTQGCDLPTLVAKLTASVADDTVREEGSLQDENAARGENFARDEEGSSEQRDSNAAPVNFE
ncbi:MAG: hypothetical protein N2C14_22505, partial [Planctomycetales bacterium]